VDSLAAPSSYSSLLHRVRGRLRYTPNLGWERPKGDGQGILTFLSVCDAEYSEDSSAR
jgi:hypothetical protein